MEQQAAKFIDNVRQKFRKGQLSQTKQDLLNGLAGWTWDAQRAKWLVQYERLVREMAKNHHRIPRRENENNTREAESAAIFAMNQRALFRNDKLSETRKNMLLQIDGWTWTVRTTVAMPTATTVVCRGRKNKSRSQCKSTKSVCSCLKRPAPGLQLHIRK